MWILLIGRQFSVSPGRRQSITILQQLHHWLWRHFSFNSGSGWTRSVKHILNHGPHTAHFVLKWAGPVKVLFLLHLIYGITHLFYKKWFNFNNTIHFFPFFWQSNAIVQKSKIYALLHSFSGSLRGRFWPLGLMFNTTLTVSMWISV